MDQYRDDLEKQQAMALQLAALRLKVPPMAVVSPEEEENLEEDLEEDLREDFEDFLAFKDPPEPADLEDFDHKDYLDSD
ncbi:hypothetical protein FNV43_RR00690 [Rhamnella rubrinervis]|uniref:Uncharacterized protein n=1 Tax=Rhamnella rubrinervis TaxID=2594499 RepID=A0A8K0HNB1_9ROSA|nr:hypothetical protein FNV43_RR00690 [Rhamnella rubrinervis]